MAFSGTVARIEILVLHIDPALSLFVDTLGMELAHRGLSPDVPAEIAVLDGGSIAITLIAPLDSDDAVFPDPTPRLSQIVFDVPRVELDRIVDDIAAAGVPIEIIDAQRAFVPPAVMDGVLGARTALVFSGEADLVDDPVAASGSAKSRPEG